VFYDPRVFARACLVTCHSWFLSSWHLDGGCGMVTDDLATQSAEPMLAAGRLRGGSSLGSGAQAPPPRVSPWRCPGGAQQVRMPSEPLLHPAVWSRYRSAPRLTRLRIAALMRQSPPSPATLRRPS